MARPIAEAASPGRSATAGRAGRSNVKLYTPANARGRVPVILLVNFGGGGARGSPAIRRSRRRFSRAAGAMRQSATRTFSRIEPTRSTGRDRRRRSRRRQCAPAPDEWGAIGAWAWGVSRIIDYLETDASVEREADRALRPLASGQDGALGVGARRRASPRSIASCAGEMGAALSRRDWGETVDDMAQNFPCWFAGNFQKWAGRWNEMPVDAHMLIALSAPRPVFITGGTAGSVGRSGRRVPRGGGGRAGLPAARQEGSRHHRRCRRSTRRSRRRSRLALSHRRRTRRRRPTGRRSCSSSAKYFK